MNTNPINSNRPAQAQSLSIGQRANRSDNVAAGQTARGGIGVGIIGDRPTPLPSQFYIESGKRQGLSLI